MIAAALAAIAVCAALIALALYREHERRLRFWKRRAELTHTYYANLRKAWGRTAHTD